MERGRRVEIDVLRGVAILLVVVYHAGPLSWRLAPYRADGWIEWPALGVLGWLAVPFLHFGFSGVHCFFVLSGFCIHLRGARAAVRGEAAVPSLRKFFLRRFWRIYPPYWCALVIFAVAPHVARALGMQTQAPPPGMGDVALHAVMLHTMSVATFFSINPAFWSLATEEQFYLGYPMLARAMRRLGAARVLGAALVLTLAWRATALAVLPTTVDHFMQWRVWVHGLFLPRWFDWILGCLVAELWAARPAWLAERRRGLAIGAIALLLLAMGCRVHVALDKLLSDPLFSTGFAALTCAVLGRARARDEGLGDNKIQSGPTPVARWSRQWIRPMGILLSRGMAALGRRSYGIYLVHQPIVDLLALPLALRGLLVAAASALFCRLCESPFEERSRKV